MVIKQEMIAFIDKVMNQKYIWIMKYLILILILAITNQSFALSEQEEFELYKEFKAQKASESSSQNQNDETNESNQKEVNVYITNSNDSKTDSGNQFNQKAFYYYENQKKSLGTAGVFAFFIPTAGHAYAGNWLRGLPFLLFEAVGVGMMSDAITYGEEECYYSYYHSYYYCEEEEIIDEDQYALGLGILVVAKIWEVFDARATAKNYNEDLKRGLNLVFTVDPRYNFVSGIQYNF